MNCRKMIARVSFKTACELGFRGSLDEWERLQGAEHKLGRSIWRAAIKKGVTIGFCLIRQTCVSPIVCVHRSNQVSRAHSDSGRRQSNPKGRFTGEQLKLLRRENVSSGRGAISGTSPSKFPAIISGSVIEMHEHAGNSTKW